MKRKTILRLAASLLCGVLLLCMGVVAEPTETVSVDTTPVAKADLPDGMSAGLENDNWRVFIDEETGRFALENKVDGTIWWSTPENAEKDTKANFRKQGELQSNLLVTYLDTSAEIEEFETLFSYTDAYEDGMVTVTVSDDSIYILYEFLVYDLAVPLELKLEEDGLVCRVPTEDIQENGVCQVYSVSVLPYFGAGHNTDDKGYLFVPDGSGAILNFNNGKNLYTQYSASMFGMNYTADLLYDSDSDEDVRMPVYGICKNDASFVAVLEEGSAHAKIGATVGNRGSSYNNVCATFDLRLVDIYYVGQSLGQSNKVTLLEDGPFKLEAVSVRIMPVQKKQGEGYVGMAKTYRQYLMAKGMQKSEDYKLELHLQLLGNLRRTKHFIGIPYEATVTVTSYEDAANILDQLNEDGVNNVAIRYINWNKKTITGKPSSGVSVIGGKKNLNNLLTTAADYGVAVYPDTEWNVVSKYTLAYSKWGASARTLGNKPVSVYQYSFTNFFKDNLKMPRYLLAPIKVKKLTDGFLPKYNKLGVGSLGIADIGDSLSADFSEDGWTRQQTLNTMESIAAAAAEENKMMFAGGNAYVLPYADRVVDVPTTSSAYDVEDESIPFYQLVLYGCVPSSGEAVNMANEDVAMPLLRALESGSSVSYVWTADDSKLLNDTKYKDWYSTQCDVWYEQAAKYGKVLSDFSAKIKGSDIASHEILGDGVRRTTWDNGVSVIVNYGDETAAVDGVKVEAKSYVIKEASL